MCQSLLFNKVAGLRSVALLRKRFWQRCFPVNFAKFLRKPFLKNTSGQLLLSIQLLLKEKKYTWNSRAYGCWNVAKIEIFTICLCYIMFYLIINSIFMLYVLLYICYMFYYIFVICLYLRYMFFSVFSFVIYFYFHIIWF